ncbi:MAG: sugar-binding protein [Bacteroidota bacterium]|nr:sugar-binding protein [Bacteroidota bacterium]
MRGLIVTVLLLIIFSQFLFSQEKAYHTEKIIYDTPKIDGVFDDEIWKQGEWKNDFTQFEPDNGNAASQKTEFKILYDDNNIYVAIKIYENDITKIIKRMSRRDGWEGDMAIVQFDSYFDKMTAFVFAVNASGVKNICFIHVALVVRHMASPIYRIMNMLIYRRIQEFLEL